MSSNRETQSHSSSTFSSASFSSYSSNVNGAQSSYTQTTRSDPSGTKVHRTTQEPGEAPREERIQYDSDGRRLQDNEARARIEGNRVEDVTEREDEEQRRKDREYEERMEDEYAKREGGA